MDIRNLDPFSAKLHHRSEGPLQLEAGKTAVLVVDMLNDFCVEGGAMVLPGASVLVAPQNGLIDAVRDTGGVVVLVNDQHRPEMRRDREFQKRSPHCLANTWGAEVIDGLSRAPTDIEIIKRRYSGFFNTDLDLTMRDMAVDTLIVVGVVTNICVRATVHDAFFHGYEVIVARDCVAATGPREQESSLYDIDTHFGLVTDATTVVNALRI